MTITPLKTPKIYAYTDPLWESKAWSRIDSTGKLIKGKGYYKIGFTTRDVQTRVKEQYPTKRPNAKGTQPYTIVLESSALLEGEKTSFRDSDVHRVLESAGVERVGGEWFACSVEEIKRAIGAIKHDRQFATSRANDFPMRPEQAQAVELTAAYFRANSVEKTGRTPHFLWNAKMRFGKTFTTYQLAREMGFSKLLVLTFKPAVKASWREDLEGHNDFAKWRFYDSANSLDREPAGEFVYFASFQDVLITDGKIKKKNRWLHTVRWDLIVLDEYHFGAWNDNAKGLYQTKEAPDKQTKDDEKELELSKEQIEFDEGLLKESLQARAYLYLSGTPFRAVAGGEFLEDSLYNWTYSDEQRAKRQWSKQHKDEPNPYAELPQMLMMIYKIPEDIAQMGQNLGIDEFDLNEFFRAGERGFLYEEDVIKWLRFIKGEHLPSNLDNLANRASKKVDSSKAANVGLQPKDSSVRSALPFENAQLLQSLQHTLWFLPSVPACKAMKKLLEADSFFKEYTIIICAGSEAGVGAVALERFKEELGNPLESKSITLTCGKLTTGVSVPCWSGVLMLRSTKSPESYFQTAFRAQTPWSYRDDNNQKHIIKEQCFVIDFAPNRALNLIADYARLKAQNGENAAQCVEEFIAFLPIIMHYEGRLEPLSAESVLELAINGLSGDMLARKWKESRLINVDNATLDKILADDDALKALENIEGFRSVKSDIETIINTTKNINKLKSKQTLDTKEKKALSEQEKERNSKRKQIREKLLQFAQKIPVFMYLSDYREENLADVIRELEPELFKRVTGLVTKEFNILCELQVFNEAMMNSAIYAFKHYEDKSFDYLEVESSQADSSP